MYACVCVVHARANTLPVRERRGERERERERMRIMTRWRAAFRAKSFKAAVTDRERESLLNICVYACALFKKKKKFVI